MQRCTGYGPGATGEQRANDMGERPAQCPTIFTRVLHFALFLPLCFFWLFACLPSTTRLFSPCTPAAHLPDAAPHLPRKLSGCRTSCPFGPGVSGTEKLLLQLAFLTLLRLHHVLFEAPLDLFCPSVSDFFCKEESTFGTVTSRTSGSFNKNVRSTP